MTKKWTRPILLMPVLLVQALCSCSLIDEDLTDSNDGTGSVSLAFDVSVNRAGTRMSDAVTQQPGTGFRGIQDLKLFPFNVEGTIGSDATSLSGSVCNPLPVSGTYHYMDNHAVDLSIHTASFLCYARATEANGGKFVNGAITATIPDGKVSPSAISFAPEVIHNSVEVEEGDKASKIAAYLTDIANAIPADKHSFFLQFINNGQPVACSSTNVAKLADWAKTEGDVDLTAIASTYDADYPSSISLPDGAAVVMWNSTEKKFVPQTETTTEANINSWNRFCYPAELWYYANSRIKTSASSQLENYALTDWSKVLAKYETDNGVMTVNVKSVAIKEPLSYAVGCLQIGLVVSETLTDAGETAKTITLNDGKNEGTATFPLKAVFVSGQHSQTFDFTAKDDNEERIIYDNQIPTGMTMGAAVEESPLTETPEKYINTLVLPTREGVNVRFALEFENDSGENFTGCNGIVFAGTRFYLVGTIEVPVGQTDDWKKRAFTKNYITRGTVRITSLKQAYTYLPDLLDPRLEIGIKLVPNWIQSTPTSVPL